MPGTKRIAIYPGTFDPITNGHLDVVSRAAELFDHIIVAVAVNGAKKPLFTVSERVEMMKEVLRKNKNVSVDNFAGLLVEYARDKKASAIVRGLRAVSDFEYEFQMALANRSLNPKITTVFLMPHEEYTYLNSSLVREIARFGGDVSRFVSPVVAARLARKFRSTSRSHPK
jgi:pantetheine-phosphate adenylyltransferase